MGFSSTLKTLMNTPRLCFIHIPKTAGTTVTAALEEAYGRDSIFPAQTMLDYKNVAKSELEKYRLYKGHIYLNYALLNLPSDTQYITLLRDPVARVVSLYKFWRDHPDDFFEDQSVPDVIKRGPRIARESSFIDFVQHSDPFVRQEITNAQLRQLSPGVNLGSSTDTIKILNQFSVVGVQELFPFFAYEVNVFLSRKIFSKILRLNNSRERKISNSEAELVGYGEATSILREANAEEIRVYERVKEEVIFRMNNLFTELVMNQEI